MRSKIALFAVALAASGCAGVGDLQAFNDAGSTGRALGMTMRTVDSTCIVLTGHLCGVRQLNTAAANASYGQLKQLPYHLKSGQPAQKVSELHHVFE